MPNALQIKKIALKQIREYQIKSLEAFLEKEVKFERRNQLKLLLRLFKYLTPFWDKYILVIILLMIQGTIHTLPFLFLSKLPLFIGTGQVRDYVAFCFLILFPAFLFRWVIFESILNTLIWYLGLKLSLKFRLDLYHHMERLSLSFYQSRPVGEHMYRANADIDSFMPLLNNSVSGLPAFISAIYQTILMAYLVSIAGPKILFYLTLILIPIYSLVYYLYYFVQQLDYKKRARAQELTAVLRESIAGIRVIKAFDRVKFTIRRYLRAMVKYYKVVQSTYFMKFLADWIRVSPVHIVWPLSLPFFAYLGLKERIPIITWASIVYFSRQLLYFLDMSFDFIQKIRLYLIPVQRLFETLDLQPEIVESPSARKSTELSGKLDFNAVNFSYQKGYPILKNISFTLHPGKKLAIIGPSGAGKSTIAMLALRLYEADSGTIKIDGSDIRKINMESVLEQTGVILQDTFLFGGTIRDNIRYGSLDATDEEVEQAAIAAGIHNDIMDMPAGYDMDVAEGTNLSGGQKQRISIARALVKKPKLILLDEATSSLDIATENAIIETLRYSFENITTIIISHRFSLVADADEILVIEKGELVEHGSHEELLCNKNLYYRLYQQQIDSGSIERGTE